MFRYALLGLLRGRARHGYELKSAFEDLTGGTWPLNEGQVYTTLARLERDGLVSSIVVDQELLPARRVYELTAAGRAALKTWLASPPDGPVSLKDPWFTKVLVQGLAGREEALALLWSQREAGLQTLATLEDAKVAGDTSPRAGLLIEAAILQVEAGLRWLDVCEERLDDLLPEPYRRRNRHDRAR